MWNTLKSFYNSSSWNTLRMQIIAERSLEHGFIFCEYCGHEIPNTTCVQVDHIKELNISNVNDLNISLNPDNLKISCHDCHNNKHGRFCRAQDRNVYIVYGSPLSGKKQYVKENMCKGDIVVDMDALFKAISFSECYEDIPLLKYNVFEIRNLLIDNIKTRYGKFKNAWIIGGYANKHDRDRLAKELDAKLIFIDTPKEQCYERLKYCDDLRKYRQSEWRKYIDIWFEVFSP